MAKAKRETRIKNERRRLAAIFADLDANKLAVCDTLIGRAAFITISLQDLEEELEATGWIETYQHGENQSGLKKSVAAEIHISLTKNLNAIIKQLLELVPPSAKKSKLEELMGS